jgi:hypothetical protein
MKFPNEIIPASAIWMNDSNAKDEYTDFYPSIDFEHGQIYTIRIACDTDRAIYLDDVLISFGQYADYPENPTYEDVTFTAKRDSKLKITVWHSGIDSQTHVATVAYVAFCIYKSGEPIYASSADTLCRMTPEYVQHAGKIITSQMGAGFAINGRAQSEVLHSSVVKDVEIRSLKPRPIAPLYLGAQQE